MYYNLHAIILKRQAFREDDLLVTIYSAEKGKLVLAARGGKKLLSKLAGHLEPVSLSYLNVVSGKSIDQLTGAQMIKSYVLIKNDLIQAKSAGWFLNLLDSLTLENHQDKNIFKLVEKYLDFLEYTKTDYAILQTAASVKLLHLLGLNPAQKYESNLKQQLEFIVKNKMEKIIKFKNSFNFDKINNVLRFEIENVS